MVTARRTRVSGRRKARRTAKSQRLGKRAAMSKKLSQIGQGPKEE